MAGAYPFLGRRYGTRRAPGLAGAVAAAWAPNAYYTVAGATATKQEANTYRSVLAPPAKNTLARYFEIIAAGSAAFELGIAPPGIDITVEPYSTQAYVLFSGNGTTLHNSATVTAAGTLSIAPGNTFGCLVDFGALTATFYSNGTAGGSFAIASSSYVPVASLYTTAATALLRTKTGFQYMPGGSVAWDS